MMPLVDYIVGHLHPVDRTALPAGGIWSMHYRAGKIATASKDCNLVVSSLSPAGKIVALHTYSQQHAGAVKCTRWSDDHVLATCGNDMYATLYCSALCELCSIL